jgi:GNAT superfamily N-acetyltransferase
MVKLARPEIRPIVASDRAWVEGFLAEVGARRVARRGALMNPLDHPMLLAAAEGAPAGLLTYVIDGDACEILTIHAVYPGHGTGTALVDTVRKMARAGGCRTLWVVTTNDNLDALRFYQRRGFRIRSIRTGAVDEARRRLKPEIPVLGDYGVPLRDEVELIQEL